MCKFNSITVFVLCCAQRGVHLTHKIARIGIEPSLETGDFEPHRRREPLVGNREAPACKLFLDPVDGDSDTFFFTYMDVIPGGHKSWTGECVT